MEYGLTMAGRGPLSTPETLVTIAKHAEDLGFDSLYLGDHIVVPNGINSPYPYTPTGEFPGAGSGAFLEQIVTLSYLAGHTSKIKLVTSVLIVPHRNPLVAAKSLATLDYLSGGRLVVGIGVGWMKEEFQALGIPPFEERGAVTDEYIRAFKELWTSDTPTFKGKYCEFSDINFLPKPVQKPHPPIWVGGESRPAMRRAAELADGWYPLGSNPTFPMGTPEQLKAGMERLDTYCQRFGRSISDIEVTYRTQQYELKGNGSSSGDGRLAFTGTADEIASDVRGYDEMGVKRLIVDFIRITEDLHEVMDGMEQFANQVWAKV